MPSIQQQFLREQVAPLLEALREDSKPLWGVMGPQHMVEHVSSLVYISLGKHQVPAFVPEEKIPAALEWLMSDKPFKQNIRVPMFPENEPMPLRFASLDAAKGKLLSTLQAFFQHFEDQPGATAVHPAFGPLNREQWEQFHYKHFRHHFAQFGLEESV